MPMRLFQLRLHQRLDAIWLTTALMTSAESVAETNWTSQAGIGLYKDKALQSRASQIGAGSEFEIWGSGREYLTSVNVIAKRQTIEKADDEESKNLELEDGNKTDIKTEAVGLGQTIKFLTNVNLGVSQTRTDQSRSLSRSFNVDRWVIPDLIKVGASVTFNDVNQTQYIYTDVDGKQIVTPDRIAGQNYQLHVMGYLASDAIGILDYSITTRDDRPPAYSLATSARQYFSQASGALHLGLTHYENVGSIRPTTSYGSIVSNQLFVEWHQKIRQNYIWMTGYRFYAETERPRAYPESVKTTGSDLVYTTFRFRLQKGWTFRSHEISVTGGKYLTNAGLSGYQTSLGLDLAF